MTLRNPGELFDDYEDLSFTPERLSRIQAHAADLGRPGSVLSHRGRRGDDRAIPDAALWVVPIQGHLPLWPELGGSAEATRESRDVIRRFLNEAGGQA